MSSLKPDLLEGAAAVHDCWLHAACLWHAKAPEPNVVMQLRRASTAEDQAQAQRDVLQIEQVLRQLEAHIEEQLAQSCVYSLS